MLVHIQLKLKMIYKLKPGFGSVKLKKNMFSYCIAQFWQHASLILESYFIKSVVDIFFFRSIRIQTIKIRRVKCDGSESLH